MCNSTSTAATKCIGTRRPFRGADRFIESDRTECSFKSERFELSYVLLNEAPQGRGVDIPKRCLGGQGGGVLGVVEAAQVADVRGVRFLVLRSLMQM
jgi:hypothetical protein